MSDMLYFKIKVGPVHHTVEISANPLVLVDVDEDGWVVGIELDSLGLITGREVIPPTP